MNRLQLLIYLFCGLSLTLSAQDPQKSSYKIACIGFYNFENLFDTLDTEGKRDEDFTPKGKMAYSAQV